MRTPRSSGKRKQRVNQVKCLYKKAGEIRESSGEARAKRDAGAARDLMRTLPAVVRHNTSDVARERGLDLMPPDYFSFSLEQPYSRTGCLAAAKDYRIACDWSQERGERCAL